MSVTIGVRFVTGEYHATAWDQAVNTGGSEWPPSPWRLVRALVSTWHTRCPDVPADRIEHLISRLAEQPPHVWLPPVRASHTRHYLPGAGHRSDEVGGTSLTLDPRLQLDPAAQILVRWPQLDLDPEEAALLGHLLAQLPYLGRAESRCEATLLDEAEAMSGPEEQHWAVPVSEDGQLRVLLPHPTVTRAQVEVTPDAMRKAKRLTPVGAHWVSYRTGREPEVERSAPRQVSAPHAVRWVLESRAPFRAEDGILATTGLRGAVLGALGGGERLAADPRAWLVAGPHADASVGDHQHAHWWWFADEHGVIRELVMWVPGGIPVDWVGRIASVRRLPDFQDAPKGYRPGAALHLQSVGELTAVHPAVAVRSKRWRTATPMLTERFPKKHGDPQQFIRREVEREVAYRAPWWPRMPALQSIEVTRGWDAPETIRFRRYRWKETMASRRRGFEVVIEFDEPMAGPVSLGALSHFGFGLFEAIH